MLQQHLIAMKLRQTVTAAFVARATRRMHNQTSSLSSAENSNEYATTYHAPVMWKECVDGLLDGRDERRRGLTLLDGTLGGGGHSEAILQRLTADDVLLGCDIDPQALKTAIGRLERYLPGNSSDGPFFVPVQSNFGNLVETLAKTIHPISNEPIKESSLDGLLLDLGVSSHQIDCAERGFSFQQKGPLDMRMSGVGMTAADLCNELDVFELKRILKEYGDEPRAAKIADSIVRCRPLSTTSDLVDAVAAVTPEYAKKGRRMGRTATLARVFQSLRIVVNQEYQVLENVLTRVAPTLLRSGGRLVVLSYHSMEDRATKRAMRDGSLERMQRDERDMYGNTIGPPRPFRTLGKKRKATLEEVEVNPRARSATLRVAEKVEK